MAGSVQSFREVMEKVDDYVKVSGEVATEVKTQADLMKAAFEAQDEFLKGVPSKPKPSEKELGVLLKPTAEKIGQVQSYKDKQRGTQYNNHYLGVGEAVTALGWVAQPSKPGNSVMQIIDSTKYYTNRVLKEAENSDLNKKWVGALIDVLTYLENFVRTNHSNGLSWGR